MQENINYAQEKIAETQHNVMEIEETQDNNEAAHIQQIVESVCDIDEAKYLIQKLFNMTLSQSHVAAQRDAKLKENEQTLAEVGKNLISFLSAFALLLPSSLSKTISSKGNCWIMYCTTNSRYFPRN